MDISKFKISNSLINGTGNLHWPPHIQKQESFPERFVPAN